jgi:hypothetical protein
MNKAGNNAERIGNEPSNKAYCTVASEKWFPAASAALMPAYFSLNGSVARPNKNGVVDRPNKFNGRACKACLQDCGGKSTAETASCFACAAKMSGGGGALCGACHCGVGAVKAVNATKCEACTAKLQPDQVLSGSNLAAHTCMRAV